MDAENLQLGQSLSRYGINAYRDNGTWYASDGSLLYEKYKKYTYHTGGIVGDNPTLKQDELFAKLKIGEAVLTEKQQEVVDKALDHSCFVPVPPEETMLGQYGALFGAAKSTDWMAAKVQSQIQKDAQQAQAVVSHGGDTFDIDVPMQIYPLQKLDDAEIKATPRN